MAEDIMDGTATKGEHRTVKVTVKSYDTDEIYESVSIDLTAYVCHVGDDYFNRHYEYVYNGIIREPSTLGNNRIFIGAYFKQNISHFWIIC